MPPPAPAAPRELVLVGGGHTHVQVLRRQLMEPFEGVRITVVLDRPQAMYSGMVPGLVAGQYTAAEATIDVRPLARRAGARVVMARATRVDPGARRLHLAGRPSIPYHRISFNIGASVRGLDLPGVRAHTVPTRPISALVDCLEARFAQPIPGPQRVVVVGAGAAGVELAFCVQARLERQGADQVQVLLLGAQDTLHQGTHRALGGLVQRVASARGIEIRRGLRVTRVGPGQVHLDDGQVLPADLVLWAAGAQGHDLFADSGLPVSDRGFVQVESDLRVSGHPEIFAVGDCAHLNHAPWVPKAGVYAVRQGPVLIDNIQAWLTGTPTRPFRPQRSFMALLNLGDGSAIGTKWGRTFHSAGTFRLKDRIDRAFVSKFQVLGPTGAPAPAFDADLPTMAELEMVCGGCAAKVGATPLSRALARLPPRPPDDAVLMGLAAADDAAALQRSHEVVVQSVDVFTAFVDDPFVVGQVAVSNALSDLYATGVRPRTALAMVTIPRHEDPEEPLFQVLAGVRAGLDAAGCTLLGGHTTVGETLSVGLAVTGFCPPAQPLWRNDDLRHGDALVLTRGLGTGVLFHADMAGRAAGPWIQAALAGMIRGNGPAAGAAAEVGVRGVTDITGFGLAGHLGEMLKNTGLSAALRLDAVPTLPGAQVLAQAGERSSFHGQNAALLRSIHVAHGLAAHPSLPLLFDPQTAGGLLLATPPDKLPALIQALVHAGDTQAACIGQITGPRTDGALFGVRR